MTAVEDTSASAHAFNSPNQAPACDAVHVVTEVKTDGGVKVEKEKNEASLLSTNDEEFGFQTDDGSKFSHNALDMSKFCHLCRRQYPDGSKPTVCSKCHLSYCARCATRQHVTEEGCACCPESDHCCHRCSLTRTEVLTVCKLATPLGIPCTVMPGMYWVQSGSVRMETNLELVGAQVRVWMSDGSQNFDHQCHYEDGLVRAYAPSREQFLVETGSGRKAWMRLVWRVEGKDDPSPHVFTETEAAFSPLDYKLTGDQQPRICYVLPDKGVICYCRSSEDGDCVQCDLCDEWYHAACTGLDATVLKALKNDSTLSFQCLSCQLFPETQRVNSIRNSAEPGDKNTARPYSVQEDIGRCGLGSRLRRRALACSKHLKRSTLRRMLYCTPAEMLEAHARHPPKPPVGTVAAEKIVENSKAHPDLEPHTDVVAGVEATLANAPSSAAPATVTTAITHPCKELSTG